MGRLKPGHTIGTPAALFPRKEFESSRLRNPRGLKNALGRLSAAIRAARARRRSLHLDLAWMLEFLFRGIFALPPRPATALDGTEFLKSRYPPSFEAREQEIFTQIISGNVPDFLRTLCPVSRHQRLRWQDQPRDVLCHARLPGHRFGRGLFPRAHSPNTAQRIADAIDCSLPTPKIVNDDLSQPPK